MANLSSSIHSLLAFWLLMLSGHLNLVFGTHITWIRVRSFKIIFLIRATCIHLHQWAPMGSMQVLFLSSFYMFVAVRAWHMGIPVLFPLEMLSATDGSTLMCLFEGFSLFPVMPALLMLKIGTWTFWSGHLTAGSFIDATDKAQPWAQWPGEPPTHVLQKWCDAKVHSDWSLLHSAITSGIGASSSWSLMLWSEVKK